MGGMPWLAAPDRSRGQSPGIRAVDGPLVVDDNSRPSPVPASQRTKPGRCAGHGSQRRSCSHAHGSSPPHTKRILTNLDVTVPRHCRPKCAAESHGAKPPRAAGIEARGSHRIGPETMRAPILPVAAGDPWRCRRRKEYLRSIISRDQLWPTGGPGAMAPASGSEPTRPPRAHSQAEDRDGHDAGSG